MSIGKLVFTGGVREDVVQRPTIRRGKDWGILIGGEDLIDTLSRKGIRGDIYIGIQKLEIWENGREYFEFAREGNAKVHKSFDWSEVTAGDRDSFFLGESEWSGLDLLEIIKGYMGESIRLEIQYDENRMTEEDRKRWMISTF